MRKLYEAIINKKQEPQILIASVVTINPLTVELSPDDTAIPVISTSNLLGLKVGSRVVLQRFGKQFIAMAIIGTSAIQLYRCTANQDLTSTNMANIAGMVFTIPANSGMYAIDTHINVRNATSASYDVKFDWEVTGTDYYTIVGRDCRGGEYQASNTLTLALTRNSAGHGWTTDVYYPLPAVNGNSHITEHAVVQAGVSDTIFQFRGSQVVTGANDPTTVSGYSHIILTKLSNFS